MIIVEGIDITRCSDQKLKELLHRENYKHQKNPWATVIKLHEELRNRLDTVYNCAYQENLRTLDEEADNEYRKALEEYKAAIQNSQTKKIEKPKRLDRRKIEYRAAVKAIRAVADYAAEKFDYKVEFSFHITGDVLELFEKDHHMKNVNNKVMAYEYYRTFFLELEKEGLPELEDLTISPETIIYAYKRAMLRYDESLEHKEFKSFFKEQIKKAVSGSLSRNEIKRQYTRERNLNLNEEDLEQYQSSKKDIARITLNSEKQSLKEILKNSSFTPSPVINLNKSKKIDEDTNEIIEAIWTIEKDSSWLGTRQPKENSNYGPGGGMLPVPSRDFYNVVMGIPLNSDNDIIAWIFENIKSKDLESCLVHGVAFRTEDYNFYRDYFDYLWCLDEEAPEEVGVLEIENEEVHVKRYAKKNKPNHVDIPLRFYAQSHRS